MELKLCRACIKRSMENPHQPIGVIIKDGKATPCPKCKKEKEKLAAYHRYLELGLDSSYYDHPAIEVLTKIKGKVLCYFYGRDGIIPASLLAKEYLLSKKTVKVQQYPSLFMDIRSRDDSVLTEKELLNYDLLIIDNYYFESSPERVAVLKAFLTQRKGPTILIGKKDLPDDFPIKIKFQGKFYEDTEAPETIF